MSYTYDGFGFTSQVVEETYNSTTGGLTNYALYDDDYNSNGSLLEEQISYGIFLMNTGC
jgi:hypothetical protein